jgi:hypothetical protein
MTLEITHYTVVSTNGILTVTKSIAVTVIAMANQKYTGMKILRCCGYWCCQWAIPSTIP